MMHFVMHYFCLFATLRNSFVLFSLSLLLFRHNIKKFLSVEAAGPNLRLSNNGLTVTNTVNKQWNAVRASVGWNTGVHYWEVHIDK